MTQTPSQKRTDNSNQDRINTLAQIVALRIDELLAELGIRLSPSGNKYIGCCPIHGGDTHSAFNIYPEGYAVPGYWKCRTRHCEEVFKPTIIGFVRGVLSRTHLHWSKKGDKIYPFDQTLAWLCRFIGQDLNEIKIDPEEQERRRFAHQIEILNKGKQKKEVGISRQQIRSALDIPADYFVKRGYSSDILSAYDVGLCNNPTREMYNRVVVPVYDNENKVMVGCTGRSIFESCKKCKAYHAPGTICPGREEAWLYSKWKNNKGFETNAYLYNLWKAHKHIQETGVVIIVEGPGDVWRLEECGIHNAVALFGCEMSDEQMILLETAGAMSVIILMDNDEAGHEATPKIKQMLHRSYNVHTPKYSADDVGSMTCNLINNEIYPVIKAVQRNGIVMSF